MRWLDTTRPGVRDQEGEKIELLGREVELLFVVPRTVCGGIDANRLHRCRSRRRESQTHTHAREQLGETERLGDVVVRTGVETGHDVGLLGAGSENDDRQPVVAVAHGAAHLEPVDVGQGEVEEHEIDVVARRCERVIAAGDVLHGKALALDRPHQGGRDRGVVLDDEDRCHGRSVRRMDARATARPWTRAARSGSLASAPGLPSVKK